MTNKTPIAVEIATLVRTVGAQQAVINLERGIATALEEQRIIKFRIRGLGTSYCAEHRPELIAARNQVAQVIERRRLLVKRLRAYINQEDAVIYAETGLTCGNCGASLCLQAAIRECFNCNHSILNTGCKNYGDGHCRCCGQCK